MNPDADTQKKEPVGPIFGIAIIVIVMLFGAVYYYWHTFVPHPAEQLPYITPDDSTTTAQ